MLFLSSEAVPYIWLSKVNDVNNRPLIQWQLLTFGINNDEIETYLWILILHISISICLPFQFCRYTNTLLFTCALHVNASIKPNHNTNSFLQLSEIFHNVFFVFDQLNNDSDPNAHVCERLLVWCREAFFGWADDHVQSSGRELATPRMLV